MAAWAPRAARWRKASRHRHSWQLIGPTACKQAKLLDKGV